MAFTCCDYGIADFYSLSTEEATTIIKNGFKGLEYSHVVIIYNQADQLSLTDDERNSLEREYKKRKHQQGGGSGWIEYASTKGQD